MTVTEESRHRLRQALDEAIGPEEATTLMEHLPPVGWADVATKTDLDHHRAATKTDLDHHRAATKTDLDHHRAATSAEIGHLREHVELRFDAVDQRFVDLIATLNVRFDGTDARHASTERRLDSIEHRLTHQFWQFLTLMAAFGAILIGVLRFT